MKAKKDIYEMDEKYITSYIYIYIYIYILRIQ